MLPNSVSLPNNVDVLSFLDGALPKVGSTIRLRFKDYTIITTELEQDLLVSTEEEGSQKHVFP